MYGTEFGDYQVLLFNQAGSCDVGFAAMVVNIPKRKTIDGCWAMSGKLVAVKLHSGELHFFMPQDFEKITGSIL